jgi:DNA-binding LytR/AlgR family response regulator
MNIPQTALIADDEPLLREALSQLLLKVWPELNVVAMARNGREAVSMFETHQPDICFLDIHMPGTSGIEVAQHIGTRAHLVFVTAYDKYALEAFEHGVLDYLVKPVEPDRLADTVERLKARIKASQPAINNDGLIQELIAQLEPKTSAKPLRWIRAQSGKIMRLIAVEDIEFLQSDQKYTLIAWRDEQQQPAEAIVRQSLKQLTQQLDETVFRQIHRSVIVNLNAVAHIKFEDNETAQVHLKHRNKTLPISRKYLHLFRQM